MSFGAILAGRGLSRGGWRWGKVLVVLGGSGSGWEMLKLLLFYFLYLLAIGMKVREKDFACAFFFWVCKIMRSLGR